MLAEGMPRFDGAFALHVAPQIPTGMIGSRPGAIFDPVEGRRPSTAGPDRGVEGRPTTDGVVLNVTVRDHEAQIVRGQQVEITEEGPTLRPWQIHYQTPDQLDDLALDAGLQLVARWGDWTGSRFDEHSSRHVSVYAPRRAS